ALLFSESQSRFLAEVTPDKAKAFEALLTKQGVAFGKLGGITAATQLVIRDNSGKEVIDEDIFALKAAWQEPLAW
ncbi:MAG: hypothetical protein JXA52_09900, partial [Planctomycetes bacterium]|nr:hypothetical protein [Planctomycetota bacterium]